MAIYDNNGTTSYEIGKLYDNDGTTSYQIGNAYDNDGTNSYLIYTANAPETATILNYSDQVSGITGGWKFGNKGGYAYHQGWVSGDNAWVMRYSDNNWSGAGWMETNSKIYISGYSKLRLKLRTERGYGDATKGNGYVYIALKNNASSGGENASYYCGGTPDHPWGNGWDSDNTNPVKYYQRWFGDNGETTIDLDISGVDGLYYVQIGRYNQTAYATFTTFFYTLTFIE